MATVRRPGSSIYDLIGTYDMTTDETYYERGINLRHGYLTERYVDDPEYTVKVPEALKEIGVLLEPTSVVTSRPRSLKASVAKSPKVPAPTTAARTGRQTLRRRWIS